MNDPSAAQSARIYGFIARDAPLAVLLRRGPSKQVRILTWDLRTDQVEPGQWLKGRIYERRCDLSPDGELFAYFAAKHRGPISAWTAICRPPLLTALSFFPKDDCWGGGGLFIDDEGFCLNHVFEDPSLAGLAGHIQGTGKKTPRYLRSANLRPWEMLGHEDVAQARPDSSVARNALNLRIVPLGEHSGHGEDNPIEAMRLRRDGWIIPDIQSRVTENRRAKPGECSYVLDPPARRHKPIADGQLQLQISLHSVHESQGRWHVETMELMGEGAVKREFGRIDWADIDQNGDVLFAKGGSIFRLKAGDQGTLLDNEPLLVADLNAMKFEPMPGDLTQPPAL